MKSLKEKNITIMGATSGIGYASALLLAQLGANIIFSGRNTQRGITLENEINKNYGNAKFIKCDVKQKEEVKFFFDQAIYEFKRIDCCFNNAGIDGEIAFFSESTEENWDNVIATNLKGIWYSMKFAIEHLLKNEKGNILNMSSTSGLVGNGFGMTAYSASKFGIIGLTKSTALEYAKRNIRINAICPAFVETPMIEDIYKINPKLKRRFEACQPIGRMAKVHEIAQAVAYLLSDESSFITGSAFVIDGGLTI